MLVQGLEGLSVVADFQFQNYLSSHQFDVDVLLDDFGVLLLDHDVEAEAEAEAEAVDGVLA